MTSLYQHERSFLYIYVVRLPFGAIRLLLEFSVVWEDPSGTTQGVVRKLYPTVSERQDP